MKRFLSIIFALAIMLSVAACGGNTEETPTTTVEKVKTNVAEPLTWDDINAIPLANDSMTEEELRQICLDFMRLQLTFGWTPSQTVTYSNGSREITFLAGNVYGGIPYISSTFGNIYTATQYFDPDNGMIDVSSGNGVFRQFANQCSSSTFWSWARISNTIKYTGTSDAMEKNGCLRVGPYTYDESIVDFHTSKVSTVDVCMKNGTDTMFESYALLKAADGIVNYSKAGHVRMVSSNPVVVRNSDGSIDGGKSYITYMDQQTGWNQQTQSNGIPYEIEGGLDVKVSFLQLFNDGYLPFTLAELNKQAPVEKGEVSMDYKEATVTVSKLASCKLTSNYAVSDVTLTVKDSNGKAVYTKSMNVYSPGLDKCYEPVSLFLISNANDLKPYSDGKYTVEITAQIGTGEKLVAYTGTLTA